MKTTLFILYVTIPLLGFGQQLVYTPVNPAFGGNTFNYNWLLSSADSQNSFTDPSLQMEELTELEQFTRNLNSQLLGQISRNLLDEQFADGLQPGTFTLGSLEVEIFESVEGLVINILDISTGEQTQIIAPN